MSFSGLLPSGRQRRQRSKDAQGTGSILLDTSSLSFDRTMRYSVSGTFPEKYWTSTSSVLDMASSYSRAVLDNISRHELAVEDGEDDSDGSDGDDYEFDEEEEEEGYSDDCSSGESVLTGIVIGGGAQEDGDPADLVASGSEEGKVEDDDDDLEAAAGGGVDDAWEDCSDTVTDNSDNESSHNAGPGKRGATLFGTRRKGRKRKEGRSPRPSPRSLVVSDVQLTRKVPEVVAEVPPAVPSAFSEQNSPEMVATEVSRDSSGVVSTKEPEASPRMPMTMEDIPPRQTGQSPVINEEEEGEGCTVVAAKVPRRWTEGSDVFGRNRPRTQSHHSRVGAVARAGLFQRDDVLRKSETVRRHIASSKPCSTPPLLPVSAQSPGLEQAKRAESRSFPTGINLAETPDLEEPATSPRRRTNAMLPEWGKAIVTHRRSKRGDADASEGDTQQPAREATGDERNSLLTTTVRPKPLVKTENQQSLSAKRMSYAAATEPPPTHTKKSSSRPFKALKSLFGTSKTSSSSSSSSIIATRSQRSSTLSSLDFGNNTVTGVTRRQPSSGSRTSSQADDAFEASSYSTSRSASRASVASASSPAKEVPAKKWINANTFLNKKQLKPLLRKKYSSDFESEEEVLAKGSTSQLVMSKPEPLTQEASTTTPPPVSATSVASPAQKVDDSQKMRAQRKTPAVPKNSQTSLDMSHVEAAKQSGQQSSSRLPCAPANSQSDSHTQRKVSATRSHPETPSPGMRRRRQLPSTPDVKPFVPKGQMQPIPGVVPRRTPTTRSHKNRIVSTAEPHSTDPRFRGPNLTSLSERRYSLPLPPRPGEAAPLSDKAFVNRGTLRSSNSPTRRKLARRRIQLLADSAERSKTFPLRPSGASSPAIIQVKPTKPHLSDDVRARTPVDPSPSELCQVPGPLPVLPVFRNIIKLDVRHVAEELTLIDAELLRKIEPVELAECAWMAKDRETRAPNIMRMVDAFNRVALLTTTKVLTPETPQERAQVISFFVKVAEECLKLHNFNSLKAILAGLQCTPMFRLKRTWREVSNNKHRRFAELSELMTEAQNYRDYREVMDEAMRTPPCIPFLGVFLTQVVQVDSFNKLHHKRKEMRNRSMRRSTRNRASRRSIKRLRQSMRRPNGTRTSGASSPAKTVSPSTSTQNLAAKEGSDGHQIRKKSLPSKLAIKNEPRQRKPIVFPASPNSGNDSDSPEIEFLSADKNLVADMLKETNMKDLKKSQGGGVVCGESVPGFRVSLPSETGDDYSWFKEAQSVTSDTATDQPSIADDCSQNIPVPEPRKQSSDPRRDSRNTSSSTGLDGPTPVPRLSASSLISRHDNVLNSVTPVPIITHASASDTDTNTDTGHRHGGEWEDDTEPMASPDPLTPASDRAPHCLLYRDPGTPGSPSRVAAAMSPPSKRVRAPSPLAATTTSSGSPSAQRQHSGGRMKERTESGEQSDATSLASPGNEDSAYCTGSEKAQNSRHNSLDSPFVLRSIHAAGTIQDDSKTGSDAADGGATVYQERAIDVTRGLLDLSLAPPKPARLVKDKRNISRASSGNSVTLSPTSTPGRLLWSRDSSADGDRNSSDGSHTMKLIRRLSRDSQLSHESATAGSSMLPNGVKKTHNRHSSLTLFSKPDYSPPVTVPPSPTANFKRDTKHLSLSRERSSYLSVALSHSGQEIPFSRTSTASFEPSPSASNHSSVSSSPARHSLLQRRSTEPVLAVTSIQSGGQDKVSGPGSAASALCPPVTPKKLHSSVTASSILARGSSPGLRERIVAVLTPKSRSRNPHHRLGRHSAVPASAANGKNEVDGARRSSCGDPPALTPPSLDAELERFKLAAAEYHHCSRPWVRYCIMNTDYNSEEVNYKLSCTREPRSPEKNKLTKLLNTARRSRA